MKLLKLCNMKNFISESKKIPLNKKDMKLAKLQGSMTRLAERSGLERTHLYRKIRQLGMELQRGVLKKNNQ